jgi:hypothetical protein
MLNECRLKIEFRNSTPIKRWTGNFLAGFVFLGLSAVAQNIPESQSHEVHFEVFSIRPEIMATGVPMNTAPSPNGFNSRLSLRQAIVMAYGSYNNFANWSSVELLRAPAWIDDVYDIRARVSNADLPAWQASCTDRTLQASYP